MSTLSLPGIEEYAQAKTGPVDPLLEELTRETYAKTTILQMLTGPLEGQFLKMEDLAITSLTETVCNDSQVERVLLPVRDGVLLIRKK